MVKSNRPISTDPAVNALFDRIDEAARKQKEKNDKGVGTKSNSPEVIVKKETVGNKGKIVEPIGKAIDIEDFLDVKYEFRYNVIVDRTEFKSRQKDEFYRLLTERDLNSIFRELKNNGYKCTVSTVKSILHSDFVDVLDPFDEYFRSLPKWDKKTDYIKQLAASVTIDEKGKEEFWQECFKKWMVAVVACALEEEHINQQVLVLSGVQGIGKSTFLNRLLPPALKGYLYSGIVNPNNKDTLVNLSENLLINLDELENLNKTELGSLKSLITQSAIRLRKAYGHFNENMTRRASFMGSVNDVEFLTDATGNRRYLCFTATEIKRDHDIDMDMVYAQAYSLYKFGWKGKTFKWWFSDEDIDRINKNNEDYLRVSNEEELLLKYFKVPKNDKYELMTPVEMIAYIEQREGIKLMDYSSVKRLGQALHKYGFKKKSVNNSKPYMVSIIGTAKSTKDRLAREHAIKEQERAMTERQNEERDL